MALLWGEEWVEKGQKIETMFNVLTSGQHIK